MRLIPARSSIDSKPQQNRTKAFFIGLIVIAVLSMLWTSLDWSWSTIDDPSYVLAWKGAIADGYPAEFAVQTVANMARADLAFGLFRPSFWFYPSVFYWLPSGIAHVVRLLMFAACIAGPLVLLHRQEIGKRSLVMAGLVIASASSLLTNGLFFLSLQELSGAAFVGLGLAVRSHSWRIALWVVAAWFKSPFSWLLIGEAVALWRRGKRLQASISLGFGLGTLTLAALFARSGDYTASYGLDPWRILTNAANLVEVWTALILVMLLWWLIVTQTSLRFTDGSLVLSIGFIGYTIQMLPWAVSGYYMGPIIYLLGLSLTSMLSPTPKFSLKRDMLAFIVPVLIAVFVLYLPLSQGFKMNQIVGEITTCLTVEGSGDFALSGHFDYVTTEEGLLRTAQNAQIADAHWRGSVSMADPSVSPLTRHLVCTTGPINIYRL